MVTRLQIVAEARSWIGGTRWHHQGMVKGVGCDCIGLVAGVAVALGLPEGRDWQQAPSYAGYGRQPDPVALLAACDRYLDRKPFANVQLGDILLMRLKYEPQHFALVSSVEPLQMIHALAAMKRVTEHRVDEAWRSKIMAVYSYRGLDG